MGIERWASGKEGRLVKRGVVEAGDSAEVDAALAAGSVSSWGGNVGNMILLIDTWYRNFC
jgi:hypothetical protein